ncbi:hypothetical protein [Paracholeplasma manati]|uniref:Lipoprotein n=1 Tax=Paracholeplasma manati TaxID=591373 RepID=A0ABT2Y7Y1_9MOLU|nr:hypothetical protein [Paracholeplasma manati]MCV2232846.1 hypothetical protein [Paracholeplasma manati]MDG0889605.1 hypothetical protein [Paracholeplasma manati]
MKKLFLVLVVLMTSLVLVACEKSPTTNPPSDIEEPVVIRQINTPETLVGFLFDLFVQGNDAYILDKNIDITVDYLIINHLYQINDDLVNIEFRPYKEQFIVHDDSYKHKYKSEYIGYSTIPMDYYYIEQQLSEIYAIKSELKKYFSLTIDHDRYNTNHELESTTRTYDINQYYQHFNLNEYNVLNQAKIASIIQDFFINLVTSAFIGEFGAMSEGNYDYDLLHNVEIHQTDAEVEFSFEGIDLAGLSYGTNSGMAVYTTVSGRLNVVNLEMTFDVHWQVYKEEQLWNESKYVFTLKQNTQPILFTSTKTYIESIDVRYR